MSNDPGGGAQPGGSPSLDQLLEGKPLEEQQREIMRLMWTDRAKYDQPDVQAR